MRRHADAARRVGFAVVGALAGLHQVDYAELRPGRPRPARTASSPGRSAAGAAGGRRSPTAPPRRRSRSCARSRTRLSGPCPGPAAFRDPAQRSQAGQLPVRSRRPRPGALGVRLGHGHARGSPGGRRDPAQLLAGSRRRARRPGDVPGRPGERSACRPPGDPRRLRQRDRPRPGRHRLVPGLRLLEDGDRAPATARPLPARGNVRRADGHPRGPGRRTRRPRPPPAGETAKRGVHELGL